MQAFEEWMQYQQPRIPDIQEAFSAGHAIGVTEGRSAGIAWAESFTAKCVLEFIADRRYELPDFLIAEIKEEFGVEL